MGNRVSCQHCVNKFRVLVNKSPLSSIFGAVLCSGGVIGKCDDDPGRKAIGAVYFVYSVGMAIITLSWKQFLLGLLIFVFFSVAEVVLAAISES